MVQLTERENLLIIPHIMYRYVFVVRIHIRLKWNRTPAMSITNRNHTITDGSNQKRGEEIEDDDVVAERRMQSVANILHDVFGYNGTAAAQPRHSHTNTHSAHAQADPHRKRK